MKSREYYKTQIISYVVMSIASLLVVLPFLLLVIASVTDNDWATRNGFQFFSRKMEPGCIPLYRSAKLL